MCINVSVFCLFFLLLVFNGFDFGLKSVLFDVVLRSVSELGFNVFYECCIHLSD